MDDLFGFEAARARAQARVLWAFDTECIRLGVEPPVWSDRLRAWAAGYKAGGEFAAGMAVLSSDIGEVGARFAGSLSAALSTAIPALERFRRGALIDVGYTVEPLSI